MTLRDLDNKCAEIHRKVSNFCEDVTIGLTIGIIFVTLLRMYT